MAPRAFVALTWRPRAWMPTPTPSSRSAVRIEQERVTATFSTLVNPGRRIPLRVQQLTGIRDEDVAVAPSLAMVLPELRAFVGPDVVAVVAHNAAFDLGFRAPPGSTFNGRHWTPLSWRAFCCRASPATAWANARCPSRWTTRTARWTMRWPPPSSS
ncbi:MAG: 3'-5' exonuclease [Caldilineaceae bacterium]